MAVLVERATAEHHGMYAVFFSPVAEGLAVVGIVCQTDEVTSVTLTIVAECMGFFARNIAPFTAGNVMLVTVDDGGCGSAMKALADLEIRGT